VIKFRYASDSYQRLLIFADLAVFKPLDCLDKGKPVIRFAGGGVGTYPYSKKVLAVDITVFNDRGDSFGRQEFLDHVGLELGGEGSGLYPIGIVRL
jgi:hypothetical protein